jgi:hypothetical protein
MNGTSSPAATAAADEGQDQQQYESKQQRSE